MPTYTITSGVGGALAPSKIQLRRDDLTTVQLSVGLAYDLTAAEVARVNRYALATSTPGAAVSTPESWRPSSYATLDLIDFDPGPANNGDVPVWDSTLREWKPTAGGAGVSAKFVFPFTRDETPLTVGVGTRRFYPPAPISITSVSASLDSDADSGSTIADVNKNGTTIFTTQANRPTISALVNRSGSTTPNVTALTSTDYLTIDRDQVGVNAGGLRVYVFGVWT